MHLETITNSSDERLSFIKDLYHSTFPAAERRDWEIVLELLQNHCMQLQVIEHLGQLLGYIIYWQLEDWLYIEHLAIAPAHQGKKLGQKVMELMIEKAASQLVLETELPITMDAKRRIEFYNRLGLQTLPFSYSQPPYRKGEPAIPTRLMSTKPGIKLKELEAVALLIKERVYEKYW